MQEGQCWVRFAFCVTCKPVGLYDDESWLDGFVCTAPDAVSTRKCFLEPIPSLSLVGKLVQGKQTEFSESCRT